MPLLPLQREGKQEDKDAHLIPQLMGDKEDAEEEEEEERKKPHSYP